MNPERTPSVDVGKLVFGVAVIVLGIGFWLDEMDRFDVGELFLYWPVLLIAIGLGKMVSPEQRGKRCGGITLIVVGTLFLLNNMGILAFGDSWPIALIIAGIYLVWQGFGSSSSAAGQRHV